MQELSAERRSDPAPMRVEWPTVGIAGLVYGGWLLATFYHANLPPPLRILVGGWIVAWHGSLQHETIHGHPTPWPRVNRLIGAPPLSLWLPYEQYRRSHLAHHAARHLTDPAHDPESRYRPAPSDWAGRIGIAAQRATSTLAGRLLLGPWVEIGGFLGGQALALARTPRRTLAVWLPHLGLVGLLMAWLLGVCRMGMAEYLGAFVYPGAALSLLRAFAEHRASPDPARRIATVERAPLFGLLFLNNNLHLAHHRAPGVAWHRLPRTYQRLRQDALASGAPVYAGYGEVAARYLFRPHDRVLHPAAEGEAGAAMTAPSAPTGTLLAGLPMYDLPELRPANDAVWAALRHGLERRGVAAPDGLTRTAQLYDLWSSPDLLVAQTCGYPFAARLAPHVRLVMTPQYRAKGCEGPYHRAAVVVRRNASAQNLADVRGQRLALNAPDSNTGMNLLRAEVAQIAHGRRWFAAVVATGGHAQSAAAVAEGRADVASIDCVTWALLQRLRPELASALRVLHWTSRCPGLPLITSFHTDAATLAALREALAELPADPAVREARRELLLEAFHLLPAPYYASPMYLQQVAADLDYPHLI